MKYRVDTLVESRKFSALYNFKISRLHLPVMIILQAHFYNGFYFYRMVISLVYYAVSFSAGTFGGNRYLVFFSTSLIEIPSSWTCIVLCRRYVSVIKCVLPLTVLCN